MTPLAPHDPAAEPGTAPLRRLGAAGVGLMMCSTVIAFGGADGSADRPALETPAAVAPAPVPHVAAAPAARPAPPFAPGAARRWSSVLGFRPVAAFGGFDDVAVREGTIVDASAGETVARAVDPFTVVIDPGHGGTDPGSRAPNGLLEKELTADIAARARRFLSELDGIEVVLTREGDAGLSRAARVARVRAADADLVVSLHFNHLPQTDVTLVESFYAGAENIAESRALRRQAALAHSGGLVAASAGERPDLSFTEGSERLASLVQRRVFGEVVHHNPRATDAGVKPDTLFVLTRSEVPGTLVELTCLSNPGEAERLEGEAYRDRLAAALADAVRDYRASLEARPLGATDA